MPLVIFYIFISYDKKLILELPLTSLYLATTIMLFTSMYKINLKQNKIDLAKLSIAIYLLHPIFINMVGSPDKGIYLLKYIAIIISCIFSYFILKKLKLNRLF
uniref:Acyltransferase family protein n=1 Tax=Providencia alcalifaciens TaxID=126385 RepID=A0A346CLM1_9GAMM|nr:hypothetical protein [Providencia alcalifaciens]